MGVTTANYVFFPSVRQGAAAGIQTPDGLGAAPQTGVVTVPVSLQVNDAPDISVSTTTLDCGTGVTGGCAQHDLVFTNTGTTGLNVGSISVSELPFAVAPVPFILGPGESRSLPVFFCPQSTGKASGTLSIPSRYAASPTS